MGHHFVRYMVTHYWQHDKFSNNFTLLFRILAFASLSAIMKEAAENIKKLYLEIKPYLSDKSELKKKVSDKSEN